MKALGQFGTTLSLVGSIATVVCVSSASPAFAIPQKAIVEKLNSVPVFLVTNAQGVPLSRPLKKSAEVPGGFLSNAYMSQAEAQAFVQQVKANIGKNPQQDTVLKALKVTPVPLGELYKQVQDSKDQPGRILFNFRPSQGEVQSALKLLKQQGKNVEQINGVPLYFVRFATNKGYVAIKTQAAAGDIIPAFLSQTDATNLLKQVQIKHPKAVIQVLAVDNIIQTLQEKNDKWLNKVVFWPSLEARQAVQKAQ
ncbi:hypothetical protein IQ266_10540 [filamentous cyanobacterium LEGE 11480]|uniref:Tic22 family protein n=1 Tax=Romeriopsis navalis LEGE 11480 TaxID=2777977 RepID=A0A928Z3M3_9CYAN|nr:Tic22 family protein [Romeriopsis navalis]MBE9030167.1 hypothetical protein [Romeriopsis navalis LEGE 11480]